MSVRRHLSQVNWRKIIEDFRLAYQLRDAWEIVLIELVANSIDAGATEIHLVIEGQAAKMLRIIDNGSGMSRSDFRQYHNLGSLTKRRGTGIGWAGIGAKLYLDRCTSVYTETRSTTFEGASKWFLPRGPKGPVWDEVPSRHLLTASCGTAVEIVVSDRREGDRISVAGAREAVLTHFNYALHPHGQVDLCINGERVAPFDPSGMAESSQAHKVRLRDGSVVEASFFLLPYQAPDGFSLLSLVVHGKTVGDAYDFHQGARIRDSRRVAGFIRCDSLVRIVTTAKDAFNRKTRLWRDFDGKIGRDFSEWLRSVGQLETPAGGKEDEVLARRVQKSLNRIFNLPEVRDLELDPFQSSASRRTPIPDPTSELLGREVLGRQFVHGALGSIRTGQDVPALGEEPGTSVLPDETGLTRRSEQERLIHSGVNIRVLPFPSRPVPAWMDPAEQAVVVNSSHPAFLCAKITGGDEFYLIATCFQLLSALKEDEVERQVVQTKLFEAYLALTTEAASEGE